MELVQIDEISKAAMDIVETAPEPDYWESFTSRLFNRISSRNIHAQPVAPRKHNYFPIRLAFYFVFSVLLLTMSIYFIMDRLNPPPSYTINRPTVSEISPVPHENPAPGLYELQPLPASNVDYNGNKFNQQLQPSEVPLAQTVAMQTVGLINNPQLQLSGQIRTGNLTFAPRLLTSDINISPESNSLKNGGSNSKLNLDFVSRQILSAADGSRSYQNKSLSGELFRAGQINPSWGYASEIKDTARAAEELHYLLELDLIKNK